MTDEEEMLRYIAFETEDQLAYVMGYDDYDDLIHDLAKGRLKGSRLQEWYDRGNLVVWEKWKRYKAIRKAIESGKAGDEEEEIQEGKEKE